MERGVGRQDRACFEPDRLTVEVREQSTRFGHDNRQGRNIEDVDVRFDHGLDLAGRQQVIVVEIAIATDAVGPRDNIAQ